MPQRELKHQCLMTRDEVAEALGITKTRVYMIEKSAIAKMKGKLQPLFCERRSSNPGTLFSDEFGE
jgi:DNA-directed RNA polymerase sigma subunit (sigma70/sigma32)